VHIEDRDRSIAPVLALVGGLMLLVGSLLSWVSVEATPLSLSVRGSSTPLGIAAAACGLVAVAWGVLAMTGRLVPPVIVLVAGIAAVVFATLAVIGRDDIGSDALADRIAEIESIPVTQAREQIELAQRFGGVRISGSAGVYLAVGGGVAAAAAGWIAAAGRRGRRPAARSVITVDLPPDRGSGREPGP
jgi:hypothetical protein